MKLRAGLASDADACVDIVRALPQYFSAETHDEVRAGVCDGLGWVAEDGAGGVVGFVLTSRRFEHSAEIAHAAVAPDRQDAGVGTALVRQVLTALAQEGVEVVLVKTLDESAEYPPFEGTRAFWRSLGFVRIDVIDPLPGWQPGNPAALFVASLPA